MLRIFKTSIVALGLAAAALAPNSASATPISRPPASVGAESQIENASFIWRGQAYCWYWDGWRGPGWYWCGYAWRDGVGWGGGSGWHGWAVPHHGRHGGGRPPHFARPHPYMGGRPHSHHGGHHHGANGHHGGHGHHRSQGRHR